MVSGGAAAAVPRERLGWRIPLVVLCVIAFRSVALLAVTAADPGRIIGEDTASYLEPARSLALHGRFFSSPDRPQSPETVRTPGYPIFVAVIRILAGPRPRFVAVAQILLSGLTILLAAAVARRLWGVRAAGVAAVLLALDPVSFLASQMLLSDCLHVFLVTAALLAGCRFLQNGENALWWAGLFGALLALAAHVRPVSYYLIVPALLIAGWSGHALGRSWKKLLVALSCVALPWVLLVGGWQLRNLSQTGSAEFSHIKGINLLLYRGAGVVAARDGIPLAQAQAQLRRSFGPREGETVAQTSERYAREGYDIIGHHPWLFLKVSLRGLVRMLLVPGEADVEKYLGLTVPPTGPLGDLARLPWSEFLRRWVRGHPGLLFLCVLALAYNLTLYLGSGLAVRRLLLGRTSAALPCQILLMTVAAYFLLVSAGPEAYARFRLPLMPILAIFAGAIPVPPRRPGL